MANIRVDKPRHLIWVEGLERMAPGEISQYQIEFRAAAAVVRKDNPFFDVLVSLEHAAPKIMMEALPAIVRDQIRLGMRKTAIVQNSRIVLMQGKRLSGETHPFSFFSTNEEALAWLAES